MGAQNDKIKKWRNKYTFDCFRFLLQSLSFSYAQLKEIRLPITSISWDIYMRRFNSGLRNSWYGEELMNETHVRCVKFRCRYTFPYLEVCYLDLPMRFSYYHCINFEARKVRIKVFWCRRNFQSEMYILYVFAIGYFIRKFSF